MVDMREVQEEINKLENCGRTTYSVCERLSVLYSVKDHAEPEERRPKETDYERERSLAGSEFMAAALRVPQEQLVEILDEHLEAVRLIYPKEYNAIMRKIKALQ